MEGSGKGNTDYTTEPYHSLRILHELTISGYGRDCGDYLTWEEVYYFWYTNQIDKIEKENKDRSWQLVSARIAAGMKDPSPMFRQLAAENSKSLRKVRQEIMPVLPPSVRLLTVLPRMRTGVQMWEDMLSSLEPDTEQYKFYAAGYRAFAKKNPDLVA